MNNKIIKKINNTTYINIDIINIIKKYLYNKNKYCDNCYKQYHYTIKNCGYCYSYLCTECHLNIIDNIKY